MPRALAGESNDGHTTLTEASQRFRVETYYVIIDKLKTCLAQRIEAYEEVNDLFGVLFERGCTENDMRKRADRLSSAYPSDLNNTLAEELIQFRHFMKNECYIPTCIYGSATRSGTTQEEFGLTHFYL